jgi:hypothetical protein
MKSYLTTAALVIGCFLINGASALSQQQWRPLNHAQRQAYYACLSSAWVADFCRGHSWGISASYDLTYTACVAANAPGRIVIANPYFTPEEYCWRRTHGLLR